MLLRTEPVSFSDQASTALERDLRQRVDGEVRFDASSRAIYSTDASNYRHPPIGVVIPATSRRWSRRSRSAASTARRSSIAAAAPASPARPATPRW
jgi:hypothetical protein